MTFSTIIEEESKICMPIILEEEYENGGKTAKNMEGIIGSLNDWNGWPSGWLEHYFCPFDSVKFCTGNLTKRT